MIFIALINNLAVLTALSVLSGFIGTRCRQKDSAQALQGLLFGSATVIGMLEPLVLGPGVIFDGRSVMISLCGLFFGPLAVGIACAMALVCRLWQGGAGQLTGMLVIAFSAALGLVFHYRQSRQSVEFSSGMLWRVGLLVHAVMLLLMLTLPHELVAGVLKRIAFPVLVIYPLATVLIGKVLSDQRARERFLEALLHSREEFRTALYSIGDGIVTTDGEGRVRQLNPQAEKLLGWTEEEARGRRYEEVLRIVDEATRNTVENPIGRVLREGRVVELTNQTMLLARDGRECPVADSAAPIRNKEGSLVGAVLVFRDQSAERASQRAVQAERDNLRAIMTASPVAIMVVDADERIVDANPAAERLFGRKLVELDDRSCGAFLDCMNRLAHQKGCGYSDACAACRLRKALRDVLDTGKGVHDCELVVNLEGQEVQRQCLVIFSMEPVTLDGRRHVMVALNDITQHRRSEEDLRRLEWMLSKKPPIPAQEKRLGVPGEAGALTELNPDGLIRKSISQEVLESIVSEYLDLLGTSSVIYEANGGYAFGLIVSGWCKMLERASRNLCGAEDAAGALASGLWRCHESCWTSCAKEAVARGAPVDVECHGGLRLYSIPIFVRNEVVGAISFSYGDPPRDPERVGALSKELQLEYEVLLCEAYAYDSRPPYIIEMAKSRLHASAWLIGSLVEARQADEERGKLEAQFRHSQKMEAIGRLAGGVAHDFNNVLQAIIGYGELLLDRLSESSETHEFAREIVVEGKRAATLTRQLLAFARKQEIDPKVLDLNEVVAATLKMLRRLLSEDIELCWAPSRERCPVMVDVSQIDQLMTNLVVNARDAITSSGKVTVEITKVTVDEAYSALNPGCAPGLYVMLAVSDNGCGMDRAVLDRLFEPFFTTKERGRGTGLGLATIYGIVKQNHGFINVYSEPQKGSTFKIYLPAYDTEESVAAEPSRPEAQPSGTETVLIVDDEESLLRSGRRILERLGYTVLAADSPAEAIRLAQEYTGDIHLLLTDVVMPGMSGRDLWRKLEALRPTMKCIFMSGYTANIIAQRSVLDKGVSFLQKPFSKAALANRLREVLSTHVR